MNVSPIKNQIKTINRIINKLTEEGKISENILSIEKELTGQLNMIKEFKWKAEPFFYDPRIFNLLLSNSELLLKPDLTIIGFCGIFSYFIAPQTGSDRSGNFLKIITADYHSECLMRFSHHVKTNPDFLFESKIKSLSGISYQVLFKAVFCPENELYCLTIHDIQSETGFRGDRMPVQPGLTANLSGVYGLLFDPGFNLIHCSGNENTCLAHQINLGNNLFSSFAPEITKRIFPFIHKALEGLENGGEIRLNKYRHTIQALPFNDEHGNMNAIVLLLRRFFLQEDLPNLPQ